MRVHLIDRQTSKPITDLLDVLEASSRLSYETALPGGMTLAHINVPWDVGTKQPRLCGTVLEVRDGIDSVWQGEVSEVTDIVDIGKRELQLTAYGPWERAARAPWTSVYTNIGWTANDIISAALFGNVERIATDSSEWSTNTLDIDPIDWTDSNVQTVIGDVLKLGDSTTSPWSFIILAPRQQYSQAGSFTFSSTHESLTGNYTGTNSGGPALDTTMYHRGAASYKFTASGANIYKTLTSTTTQLIASCWVFIDKLSAASNHEIMTVNQAGSTRIANIFVDGSNIIKSYNTPAAATYTATNNQTLGRGCWHHIELYVKISATVGVITVYLDGQAVINQTSLNTGTTNIGRLTVGIDSAGTDRIMWIDDVVAKSGTSTPTGMSYRLQDEYLPFPLLFKYDISDYDFIVSLADLGGRYSITESLKNVANQLDIGYDSAGTTYGTRVTNTVSITRYGQLPRLITAKKTASSTVAGYIQERILEQRAEPIQSLRSFTLYTPPQSKAGSPYPLSRLRAGLRFRIRELPDLGNIYIGQTKYTRAELRQVETCEITPNEPPASLAQEVARRTERSWT